MLKNKTYEVTVSVNATVTIVVEAANEEEAKSIVEEMKYTEFEGKEYEVHGICDIDASSDVKRFDVCAVCDKKLFIEDACYEDSISGRALCDGHAVYVEDKDVYTPDFDILIENAIEAFDQSEDFWHGTTHYDVNIFEKDCGLWASVYQVKDEQTDVHKVVYSKKLIAYPTNIVKVQPSDIQLTNGILDLLKATAIGTYTSNGENANDYDALMSADSFGDIPHLVLWEPFENYPIDAIKEYAESEFDSLCTVVKKSIEMYHG